MKIVWGIVEIVRSSDSEKDDKNIIMSGIYDLYNNSILLKVSIFSVLIYHNTCIAACALDQEADGRWSRSTLTLLLTNTRPG